MPVQGYPSRASGGHVENSGNKGPKTVPLGSVPLTRKVVHIRPPLQIGIVGDTPHEDMIVPCLFVYRFGKKAHTLGNHSIWKKEYDMGKSKKKELEKLKLHQLTPQEQLKYEIAEELGLLDQVLQKGWKSLSAKETGRIGGLMTKRKKELNKL